MNGAQVGVQINAFSKPPAPGYCLTGETSKTAFQRSVELRGPAGRLEAVLNEGAPNAPFAALVCHPHPLGGGTMHNKVVYHAMKVLNAPRWGFRAPVLRFNFRGAGLSEGMHDGAAEIDDVDAALAWLEGEFRRPILAAGFSFGAAMTLGASCRGSQPWNKIRALALLGLPVHADGRDYSYPCLGSCPLPKLFLSGDHDRFAPAGRLEELAAAAAEPKRLVLVPGADHFFSGRLEAMQAALAAWLKEQTQ
jgi:alpha/beta superfamily hydrolase